MLFDIDALDAARSYKLLTATVLPRPIAWIVTRDGDGLLNAAPFSFFNCFGGHPPVVCIGIGQRSRTDKDTLSNLRGHGEFVVNLVSDAMAEAMNETATDFPRGIDELATVGVATAPSAKVDVPRIADAPVAYECALRDVIDVDGSSRIVLATVLAVHVRDDAVLDAQRAHIDAAKLDLIGRMQSPGGYVRTRDTFKLKLLGYDEWLRSREERAGS